MKIEINFRRPPHSKGSARDLVEGALEYVCFIDAPELDADSDFIGTAVSAVEAAIKADSFKYLMSQADTIWMEIKPGLGERYYFRRPDGKQGWWHRFATGDISDE